MRLKEDALPLLGAHADFPRAADYSFAEHWHYIKITYYKLQFDIPNQRVFAQHYMLSSFAVFTYNKYKVLSGGGGNRYHKSS